MKNNIVLMAQVYRISRTLFTAFLVVLFFFPILASAGSYQIFSDNVYGGDPSVNSGTTITPSSLTTANSIQVVAEADAYAGSQCGCNAGMGANANVQLDIETFIYSDSRVASDPISISGSLSRTFTKSGSDWVSGASNVGTSIDVQAYVNAGGNDMVGDASASAWVYWVDPTFGTIEVDSNIPGASWVITGPSPSIVGSGTSETYSNQTTGSYTIVWGSVSGYTKPTNQSLTLNTGGTITFSGNYVATVPSCTYQLDTFPSQNNYYEVRFCNSVAPGKTACDPTPNATCGAVPFFPTALCPGGATAGGASSAAHGSVCRIGSTQSPNPPGFLGPEPGACYAQRLRTVCSGGAPFVELNFVQ